MLRSIATAAAVGALTASLAACGGSDDGGGDRTDVSSSSSAEPGAPETGPTVGSSSGSAAQVRKLTTSCAICSTEAVVPSLNSTCPSPANGAAMAICSCRVNRSPSNFHFLSDGLVRSSE